MVEIKNHELSIKKEISFQNGTMVHLAKLNQSNLLIAKKLIPLEVKPSIKDKILKELSTLVNLKSPFVVQVYEANSCDEGINIYMEYMDGGSLDLVLKKVNRIPENILGKITESVLMGLKYLSDSFNINHNNLRPSNILMNSNGLIKISDIDVSIDLTKEKFLGNIQNVTYSSPEVFEKNCCTVQSDIWSLGLSLVEMAIGRYPIPVPNENEIVNLFQNDPQGVTARSENKSSVQSMAIFELLDYIVHQPPPSLPKSCFSEEFLDFLDTCLRKEPSERGDLKSLLQHPFIQKYKNEPADTVISWINKVKRMSISDERR